MKHMAALAAITLPVLAQAETLSPPKGEIVFECQISEECGAGGCKAIEPPYQATINWDQGAKKGLLMDKGEEHEVLVFPGLGTHEFLLIGKTGTVGFTIKEDTGAVAVRASGGMVRNERGQCQIHFENAPITTS